MRNDANRRFATIAGAAAVGVIVLIAVTAVVLATRGDRAALDASPQATVDDERGGASLRRAKDAIATIEPASGSEVRGTVAFEEEDGKVRVHVDIIGLRPGTHGFHIHEKGDCSAPDASSAGDHFNPGEMPHAGPDAAGRHAGDLGNILADESGTARTSRIDDHLSLDGRRSIVGRAVVVHADSDDLVSQPSGNAGARVGCGVIRGAAS
jgi:Cu-Zn family superoxide dismutase